MGETTNLNWLAGCQPSTVVPIPYYQSSQPDLILTSPETAGLDPIPIRVAKVNSKIKTTPEI